jgi:hypothetical protein
MHVRIEYRDKHLSILCSVVISEAYLDTSWKQLKKQIQHYNKAVQLQDKVNPSNWYKTAESCNVVIQYEWTL